MSDENEYVCPFQFKSYSRSLSRGQFVPTETDNVIPNVYKNEDHITILCHACNCYMVYHNDLGTRLDGYYECPECGKRIREETPYRQLQRDDLEDDKRERRRQEKLAWENDNDWD